MSSSGTTLIIKIVENEIQQELSDFKHSYISQMTTKN